MYRNNINSIWFYLIVLFQNSTRCHWFFISSINWSDKFDSTSCNHWILIMHYALESAPEEYVFVGFWIWVFNWLKNYVNYYLLNNCCAWCARSRMLFFISLIFLGRIFIEMEKMKLFLLGFWHHSYVNFLSFLFCCPLLILSKFWFMYWRALLQTGTSVTGPLSAWLICLVH
jgi:hypothetical protein